MSEWPIDPRRRRPPGWPMGPDHARPTEPPIVDGPVTPPEWPRSDQPEIITTVPLGPPPGPAATPPAEPARPRRGVWRPVAAVFGVLVLLGVGALIGLSLDDDEPAATDDAPVGVVEPAEDDEPDATDPVRSAPPTPIPVEEGPVPEDAPEPVAAVAAAVAPSVVRIDTDFGTGSGIVYDDGGLIITNAHVVGTASEVEVQLADGTRTTGEIVGRDGNVDIAVIRIDDSLTPEPAVLAPTSTVQVGQMAVAIGSPFGLEQSVTAGIISAVNRAVPSTNVFDGSPTVVEMVQTDAPINPGNSGGALADRQGRVVGVNTSIRTDGTTQGNLGVGFAIPSDTARLVADRIVAGDPLESGFLGVSGQDPTSGAPGALVTEVVPDGPAADAGLRPGDLIVGIDGVPVLGMTELAARIRLSLPGTVVTLEVVHEGSSRTVDVTLGSLG